MAGNILNYHPDMDDRLADLLNIGWAGLRGFPRIYVKQDMWPTADPELLARWRAEGRLSEAGTFVAEHDDGNLAAVFSVSPGHEQTGTLHFFCVNAHYGGRGYGSRTLQAAEDYLRQRGMTAVVTEPMDSRCPARNGFIRKKGYSVPDPDEESIMMVLQPRGYVLRDALLPDDTYEIVTWRDEYLDNWLRVKNAAFNEDSDRSLFLEQFRSRHDFDPAGWFLLRHNGQFVGVAGALICTEPDGTLRGGQLEWVGVLPQYRGKNLGEALVVTALNHFVERDIKPVALITQLFRKPAVALYEKLGFGIAAHLHRYRKQL